MKNSTKNTNIKAIIVSAVAVLIFCIFLVGTASLSSAVTADKSNDTSALYTSEILSQAGITLAAEDEVIRQDADGAVSLTIIRAFDVDVVYRGESFAVKCTGGTVSDAIAKAGITLTGCESVYPDLDEQVTASTVVEILADCTVELTDGGETRTLATKALTVGEFLADMDITVNKDDILSVSEKTAIEDGMSIAIQRVEYKEEVRSEIIDYEFVTEETSSMKLGVTKIDTYGVEGEKEITYKCKYVDGELVDEEVVNEEIIRYPVNQVELVGTYEEKVQVSVSKPSYNVTSKPSEGGGGTFTDANGNTVSYSKVLTGSATAYYAAEGAYTATGVPVHVGGVAVNPNIIPYGTKLYIVSSDGSMVYGYATAVDTGGALMSGEALVDVFYPTYDECVSWGRRNVTVYILD